MAQQGNWKVLEIEDLANDDKLLWEKYHRGQCPGLAEGMLDGSGARYFGIALLRNNAVGKQEKLVLLKTGRAGISVKTLVKSESIALPHVTWRASPGRYLDYNTGRYVDIKFDSIIYEEMEASSTQFYFDKNAILSLVASN